MNHYINEEEKLRHPYHKIMELSGDKLQLELNLWSRENLIKWLSWNDKNGIYKDEESLMEIGKKICKEEAMEIITEQITEA